MNSLLGLGLEDLANPYNIGQLMKALDTNALTDEATLTGGAAFRVQSLDNLMQNTTFGDTDFQFWPRLKIRPVKGVLDQYVVRSAYGNGFNFAPQGMNPIAGSGVYKRKTLDIKFALTYRSLTHVLSTMDATGGNIVNARAAEEKAGAMDLAATIERACFFGDSACSPNEFDGLLTWAANNGDGRTIQDMNATPLNTLQPFYRAGGIQASNAGRLTDFYLDTYSKMDFDLAWQTAFRFGQLSPDAPLTAGAAVGKLNTSAGTVDLRADLFLNPERGFINPEDDANTDPYWQASSTSRGGDANNPVPAVPTGVTVTATGAGGNGTNMPSGGYYVTACSKSYKGESAAHAAVHVTGLTAGQQMAWSITTSDATVECFRLFKSAVDGPDTDMRYFATIPCAGPTTTYIDTGADIPGTTIAFGTDQRPDEVGAVDMDQLLAQTKLMLAIVSPNMPWLQLQYLAMRVTKPKRIQVIKNILPSALREMGWNPLGAS